jgi:hypothetical protein
MHYLNQKPNIPDVDGFYAELLTAHKNLSAAQSAALNARLVLVLANHIGDRDALREAIEIARQSAGKASDEK